MKPFHSLLKRLYACDDAGEWAYGKSIEEVVATCHRGDWLLWLAERVGVEKRLLVLAGGLCANTVRHLMRDERSTRAVDVAIAYGRGEASDEELRAAAAAAASAAARAAWAAASAAAAAAASADAAAAAWGDANAASILQTADIAREVLGEQLILKVNEMLQ